MRLILVAIGLLLVIGTAFLLRGGNETSSLGQAGYAERLSPLVVGPAELDFGTVLVGKRERRMLLVTNAGDVPMRIEDISITPPFRIDGKSLVLAPGESGNVSVYYEPDAVPAQAEGSVVLRARALPGGRLEVPVHAASHTPPEIFVDPLRLAFGQVPVGATAHGLVTIENRGGYPLYIENMSSPAPFNVGISELVIEPGEQRNIDVQFSPEEVADLKDQMLIRSDDPSRGLVMVNVYGSGTESPPEPIIEVTSRALDFGQVNLSESRERVLVVRNAGSDPLSITGLISTPPFRVRNRGQTIAPGAAMRIPIVFDPTEEGKELVPLGIHSNDPEQGLLIVSLVGEGTRGPSSVAIVDEEWSGTDLRYWAGVTRFSDVYAPPLESGQTVDRPGGSDSGDAYDGYDPAADPDSLGSGLAIGDQSYVYVGTHRTAISGADLQALSIDPVTRSFELQQLTLPPVEFPFGQSFEFPTVDVSGLISASGDVSIPIQIPVTTEAGTEIMVDMTLTTETATVVMPDGTQIAYDGAPFDGSGVPTLVGVASPGGVLDGFPIVVIFEVGP